MKTIYGHALDDLWNAVAYAAVQAKILNKRPPKLRLGLKQNDYLGSATLNVLQVSHKRSIPLEQNTVV